MSKLVRSWKMTPVGIVAASAAAALTSSTIAGVFQETHVLQHVVDAPSWASTHELSLSLPQFDTQGGTRQLQSVDMTFLLGADQMFHFSGNRYESMSIGTGTSYSISWTGLLDGDTFLPSPYGFHEAITMAEVGTAVIAPMSEAFSAPQTTEVFVWEPFSLTHPDLLATLTGSGTLDITSQLVLSEFEYFDPTDPDRGAPGPGPGPGPGPEPPDLWDPNSFSIEIDSLWANASITYNYTIVPGPGALSIFLVGGIALRRRRRAAC